MRRIGLLLVAGLWIWAISPQSAAFAQEKELCKVPDLAESSAKWIELRKRLEAGQDVSASVASLEKVHDRLIEALICYKGEAILAALDAQKEVSLLRDEVGVLKTEIAKLKNKLSQCEEGKQEKAPAEKSLGKSYIVRTPWLP